MSLQAKDPDLPPNGAPFTYYLIGGRHKSFVTLDKNSGLLRTARLIDREVTPQLDLVVEVEDSGSPRMQSQHQITVNVNDQNDIPSTPRVAHVLVYVYEHKLPIGKIADVKPNDLDTTGDYRCQVQQPKSQLNGLIIPNGCELHTTVMTKPQNYAYSISGNDGKHADVLSTISVEFLYIDNQTLDNSIIVRIENMSAQQFLTSYHRNFVDLTKSTLETGDELVLFSLHDTNANLDLSIAVKGETGSYRSPSYIIEKMNKKRNAILRLLQSSSVSIGYTPCHARACDNGGSCSEQLQINEQETRITDSPSVVHTSPMISHEFICKCSDGYTGQNCSQRQDPCSPNPCRAGGQCRRQGYDFQCECPPNHDGKYCQLERGEACMSNPCKNGGSCRHTQDGTSFFCLCHAGYRGNQCESVADSCRPNPCLYGGQCVTMKPGYKCSCADGRYGRHCERTTFGFQELSYMAFPALDPNTNDISIIFATTKSNSLLLYNYGVQNGGRSDFVAIELIRGKSVFSFGGTRTAITSVETGGIDGTLANGKWYKLIATRNGRVLSLSVSKCTDNGDSCEECRPGNSLCYAHDVGPTG